MLMANFWKRLFQLQEQTEQSSPSRPAIHELIERNADQKADYEQWKNSFVLRRLLDWLGDQYAIYLHRPRDVDDALSFLDTPSSKGFIIHFNQTNYSQREITHLFDYFKERVLQLNYRTQISDTRTYNRKHWVETVEKHYLKPRIRFEEGQKMDQQYGNIMIELEMRDDVVNNLRLRATHYHDFNYLPPQAFRGLVMQLLG